jgi:hypothetical protein
MLNRSKSFVTASEGSAEIHSRLSRLSFLFRVSRGDISLSECAPRGHERRRAAGRSRLRRALRPLPQRESCDSPIRKNGVEGSGDVGCYESNLGLKPWGPATEVRICLIDPERAIVIGYAVLYYGDSPRRMQINEIFKVLDGRIRMVDNIGLMQDGITTSGFTQ